MEYIVKCEMSAVQRQLYNAMQKYNVLLTEGGTIQAPKSKSAQALQHTVIQLQKICHHPYVFEEIGKAFSNRHTESDEALSSSSGEDLGLAFPHTGEFWVESLILLSPISSRSMASFGQDGTADTHASQAARYKAQGAAEKIGVAGSLAVSLVNTHSPSLTITYFSWTLGTLVLADAPAHLAFERAITALETELLPVSLPSALVTICSLSAGVVLAC